MPVAVPQGWFQIVAPADMLGFPVTGLVSQLFAGVNGLFDQTYPVQWRALPEEMAREEAAE